MADTNKQILIIEDDKSIANVLSTVLLSKGYNIQAAIDGTDGLDKINSNQFDLVLLDIILPKLDGISVLKKLIESGNKTPVVVMSNLDQPEDSKHARELGAKDYVIKSNISIDEIDRLINKYT